MMFLSEFLRRSRRQAQTRFLPESWFVSRRALRMAGLLFALVTMTACVQKLSYQPKYGPLEESTFFADGQASRPLVPGTVARGMARTDPLLYSGQQDGKPATEFPFRVTTEVVQRGQERFNIYCTPCHGYAGNGDGLVVQRGFPAPPSLHEERLRQAPVGYLFSVITDGHGVMPSYSKQIEVADRWAIIAYVRALQLSEHATAEQLPPAVQQQVGGKP